MTNRIDSTNCTHDAALARIKELEGKLSGLSIALREVTDKLDAKSAALLSAESRLQALEKELSDARGIMALGGAQTESYSRYYEQERAARIVAESRLGEARNLIAQARDALNPAVSPVTRGLLDKFLEGAVERQENKS